MKIQLLSPAGEIHRHGSGIFKTALRYAPLTLTTLAALVPEELNAEITIQDEGVQPLDLDFDADLVGITAITGTALRAYQIADELRAKGPHRRHRRRACDALAGRGRASCRRARDRLRREVVAAIAARLRPRRLEAALPCSHRPQSLDGVPIARRDLLKKKRYATVNSIEADARLSAQVRLLRRADRVGQHLCPSPIDEVVAELQTFEGRHAVFIDLSPVEDVHYAKALYRAMIPLRIPLGRPGDDADRRGRRIARSGGAKRLQGLAHRFRVDQPGHAERRRTSTSTRRKICRGRQEAARSWHRHPGLFRVRLRQRR